MRRRKSAEYRVQDYIEDNTNYEVENLSPSSYEESFTDSTCMHTGISDFILRHIELNCPKNPQRVVYRGVPDLVCYKRKSVLHVDNDKYEITNHKKLPRTKGSGMEFTIRFDEKFSLIKEMKFIEVKRSSGSLNKNQREWIRKFSDIFEVEIAEVSGGAVFFYEASSYLDKEYNSLAKGELA